MPPSQSRRSTGIRSRPHVRKPSHIRGSAAQRFGAAATAATNVNGLRGQTASPFASWIFTTSISPRITAIPPTLAVAQQVRRPGEDVVRAILTAYEIDVALIRAIDLHSHKIDHIAHLAPAVAAGLGT